MLDIDRKRTSATGARAVGAGWLSAGLHVAIAAILSAIVYRGETTARVPPAEPEPAPKVVWLARPGPPKGGGENDNRTRELAPRAQRPGTGRLTVPAHVPPSFHASEHREPAVQEISIPAIPEAAGLRELPGVLSSVSVVASAAQGPGSGPGAGDGDGPGLGPGWGGNTGGGPAGPGSGVDPPQLISQVRPNYASSSLMARVQGVVGMEAVVLPDGSVGDVRIIRSLDRSLGLDEQAIKAVKLWRFRPASRLGKAMPMFVSIEMTFSLR